jgi:hypothetical protein
MRKMRWSVLIIGIAPLMLGSCQSGNGDSSRQSTFYVASHGNDGHPGTKESPWRTLAPVTNYPFSPGDTVFFARGARFTGGFIVSSSGKAGKPITFTAYGSGEAPSFTNPDFNIRNGNAIQIIGDFIVIDGLFFHDCATVVNDSIGPKLWEDVRKLGAIFIAAGANHNIVQNCEVTRCPVGIKVYGQNNLITHNFVHDNNEPMAPHWGPIGIVVCTSNNEISYNRIVNYVAPSKEYGHDGGAIEIDDRKYPKQNIQIHHNYSKGNQGFIEFVGRTRQDHIIVHHNVCVDYQAFIGFTGPCTNIRVENNTVVRVLAHKTPDSEDVVFWSYFENSGILIRNNIFYYDPFRVEQVFSRGVFPRGHNLYYRTDNPKVSDQANADAFNRLVLGGGAWPGEGDKIGDPLFVDLENHDLRLQADSPAIDAGIDLGYTEDFDNHPIPSGAAPDMGAFEYQKR